MPDAQQLSYCAAEVRRHDPDRFLTALLAPADRREALLALYAFNLEVAKTREVVTEPMLGQIRLQWWRDGVEALFAGRPPAHEVLTALGPVVRNHDLPRESFDVLIEAREADLLDEPQADLNCLLSYAEVTSAPLMRLALRVLGADDEATVAAGRQVGIAYALSGLLRVVSMHAQAHRLYLPLSHLEAEGVTPEQVFALKPSDGLRRVVRTVAEEAAARLSRARERRGSVNRDAVPALSLATAADANLAVLRKVDWNPFDPRLGAPQGTKALRMTLRAALRRY